MGFSRQEYWSGLPFPSPEDLPDTNQEKREGTQINKIIKEKEDIIIGTIEIQGIIKGYYEQLYANKLGNLE